MSRPSCSSRGLAGLAGGSGCVVIARVSQLRSCNPALGQLATMSAGSRREAPDRNLALELVRVTEAGAMAAGRWVGRGDKEGGDGAAVDAIRQLVNSVSMRGVVVIGEGEKDEAPMLYNGEHVGNGRMHEVEMAVGPIDGKEAASLGQGGALSVLALAERGAMFNPGPCVYMEKIVVGPEAAGQISIEDTPTNNLEA